MSENKKLSISVFFPAFNDAKSIGKLVKDACEVLTTLTDEYEVIVINDGSTDETGEVLEDLRKTHRFLKIIHHEKNGGYGAALQSGFQAALKELIFYTDGDGQYDVREMPLLFQKMNKSVDVVNGYKIGRADGKRRRWLGGTYNQLAH